MSELRSFESFLQGSIVYHSVIRTHVRSECTNHVTPPAVPLGTDFTGNLFGYRIRSSPRGRQQRSRVEKESGLQTAERGDLQWHTSDLSGTKGHWPWASRQSKEPKHIKCTWMECFCLMLHDRFKTNHTTLPTVYWLTVTADQWNNAWCMCYYLC